MNSCAYVCAITSHLRIGVFVRANFVLNLNQLMGKISQKQFLLCTCLFVSSDRSSYSDAVVFLFEN